MEQVAEELFRQARQLNQEVNGYRPQNLKTRFADHLRQLGDEDWQNKTGLITHVYRLGLNSRKKGDVAGVRESLELFNGLGYAESEPVIPVIRVFERWIDLQTQEKTPHESPSLPITGDLVEQVSLSLKTATENTVHVETSINAIKEYLLSIPLPNNSKIEEITARIVDGKLGAKGKVGTKLGDAKFDLILENNPAGGLRLAKHKIDISFGLNVAGKGGMINDKLKDLDGTIRSGINSQIDQGWQTSNIQIAGDNLAIDFSKKPAN